MRDHELESMGELDAQLRHYGSSLEKQLRYYGENLLGQSIMRNHIRQNPDVTHQEMLDYYNAHAVDYALTAKARFEILTVKFANFPDRTQAWNAICAMGNEVFFGKVFAAVARQSSQEPNAANGGQYDWISQGSLASEPIDRAVFTLEVGKLSQVIEDATGFHIVRVQERQEAGSVSFVDAQPKIKEAIQKEKREADYKKFLVGLSTRTKVWTVFEEDVAIAKQPGSTMQR
jgi:peptidyl-prolyl cis-trans isomerase C